ncbi:hypothetical protein BC827DRAFT_1194286 [Russula dissimulans]|nr:hypothetical protein BC827DRAFT_1194286 [Russula dissimulans]
MATMATATAMALAMATAMALAMAMTIARTMARRLAIAMTMAMTMGMIKTMTRTTRRISRHGRRWRRNRAQRAFVLSPLPERHAVSTTPTPRNRSPDSRWIPHGLPKQSQLGLSSPRLALARPRPRRTGSRNQIKSQTNGAGLAINSTRLLPRGARPQNRFSPDIFRDGGSLHKSVNPLPFRMRCAGEWPGPTPSSKRPKGNGRCSIRA